MPFNLYTELTILNSEITQKRNGNRPGDRQVPIRRREVPPKQIQGFENDANVQILRLEAEQFESLKADFLVIQVHRQTISIQTRFIDFAKINIWSTQLSQGLGSSTSTIL